MIKQGFFQAVELGRGDRLKIGADVLLRGQIWPASEALRLGLIDDLGSETDAYHKAAQLAHLWHYGSVDLRTLAPVDELPIGLAFFLQTKEGLRLPYPSQPGLYMLYVPSLPTVQK